MRFAGRYDHSQSAFGNRVRAGPSLRLREHQSERTYNRVGAGLPAFEIALFPEVAVLFEQLNSQPHERDRGRDQDRQKQQRQPAGTAAPRAYGTHASLLYIGSFPGPRSDKLLSRVG